jgi:hypothetical protein
MTKFEYSGLFLHQQLKEATFVGVSGQSIHKFRETVMVWMRQHQNTAVLVSLIGHSVPATGEIVYATPGSKTNKYTNIDNVSDKIIIFCSD